MTGTMLGTLPDGTSNPLKTIPAVNLSGVGVKLSDNKNSIIYSPMGFATSSTGVVADAGAIYVWPRADSNEPSEASYVKTVCLGTGGKVTVVKGLVDVTAAGNACL
jgi:hypothetical protein